MQNEASIHLLDILQDLANPLKQLEASHSILGENTIEMHGRIEIRLDSLSEGDWINISKILSSPIEKVISAFYLITKASCDTIVPLARQILSKSTFVILGGVNYLTKCIEDEDLAISLLQEGQGPTIELFLHSKKMEGPPQLAILHHIGALVNHSKVVSFMTFLVKDLLGQWKKWIHLPRIDTHQLECRILAITILRKLIFENSQGKAMLIEKQFFPFLNKTLHEQMFSSQKELIEIVRLFRDLFNSDMDNELCGLLPVVIALCKSNASEPLTEALLQCMQHALVLQKKSLQDVIDGFHCVVSQLDGASPMLKVTSFQLFGALAMQDKGLSQRKCTASMLKMVFELLGIGYGQNRGNYTHPKDKDILKEAFKCAIDLGCNDKLAQKICGEGGDGLFAYLFSFKDSDYLQPYSSLAFELIRNLAIDAKACISIIECARYLDTIIQSGHKILRLESFQILRNIMLQNLACFGAVFSRPSFLLEIQCNLTQYDDNSLVLCSLDIIDHLLSQPLENYGFELISLGFQNSLSCIVYLKKGPEIISRAMTIKGKLLTLLKARELQVDPWKAVCLQWNQQDIFLGRNPAHLHDQGTAEKKKKKKKRKIKVM
jgi:hypothetical protein